MLPPISGFAGSGGGMSEIERIAGLLAETIEGQPYYGPSVLATLKNNGIW